MEQVFASASFTSHLLVELIEVLFCGPALTWVARIQKFLVRCLPLLVSLVGFLAVVLRIQDDSESATPEESKVKAHRHRGEDLRVRRGDVDVVMERLGLGCSCEDEQLKEVVVGAGDLNGLFEEREPSLEEVKEAFAVFDRNGDGYIDAEELQRVLSILEFKEGSTVGECRRMIGAYDENGDGMIDFPEFVKFMEGSFC